MGEVNVSFGILLICGGGGGGGSGVGYDPTGLGITYRSEESPRDYCCTTLNIDGADAVDHFAERDLARDL